MNTDVQLSLTAAPDRAADAKFFVEKVQGAVVLDEGIERRKLGLASYHLAEVQKLLGSMTTVGNPGGAV